jgi:diketogulonate reductase-like aldo/keto reductase
LCDGLFATWRFFDTNLLRDPTLAGIGAAHGCSAAAVALAWTIRSGHVIVIPESGSAADSVTTANDTTCPDLPG